MEPTNDELKIAFSLARALQEAGDLQRIRDRRTTWFGTEELKLRRDIDEYLRLIEHGEKVGNYMIHKYPKTL